MLALSPGRPALHVVAVGAHPDDVEIGAGGLLMTLAASGRLASLRVLLLTGEDERVGESRACLAELVAPVVPQVHAVGLPDTRLPTVEHEVKSALAEHVAHPCDLLLTHHPRDAHQDHRLLGERVPTVWRDHLVLGFEIPKWDGDLGRIGANVYVPLSEQQVRRKWDLLDRHHVSQRGHDWWDEETFRGLARLRGVETRTRYAEAFRLDKAVLDLG